MPASKTYPGVYVEEVPSGVHSIAGVSTSDTAFIDCFKRGVTDEAVRITSFGDFVREFGGLYAPSEASYAIQQFYLNGGQIAWVVRVTGSGAKASKATLDGSSPAQPALEFEAASPGTWGDSLEIVAVRVLKANGTVDPDVFNLAVREVQPLPGGGKQVVAAESFRNLSMTTGASNHVKTVVNDGSRLVRVTSVHLGQPPAAVAPNVAGDGPDTDSAFQAFAGGNDGGALKTEDVAGASKEAAKTGMYALGRIAPFNFNLMCLPLAAKLATTTDPTPMQPLLAKAQTFCEAKRAFLIVDIPEAVDTPDEMVKFIGAAANLGLRTNNSAIYFPRLTMPDPLQDGRAKNVGASGTLAGIYARTDATRGIWKAPAGTEAALRNAQLAATLTDLENGSLNPLGVNALRVFPIFGTVSWGGRTLNGADQQASEWKYISVRRTALYIEESLYQGLQWVVFEPNDEPLWAQIRLNVGVFMNGLFRQGAFQGNTPSKAYLVKCDSETTTQADIDLGIVNILVGFAPLKPAEFVVIQIQQRAGQLQT